MEAGARVVQGKHVCGGVVGKASLACLDVVIGKNATQTVHLVCGLHWDLRSPLHWLPCDRQTSLIILILQMRN